MSMSHAKPSQTNVLSTAHNANSQWIWASNVTRSIINVLSAYEKGTRPILFFSKFAIC